MGGWGGEGGGDGWWVMTSVMTSAVIYHLLSLPPIVSGMLLGCFWDASGMLGGCLGDAWESSEIQWISCGFFLKISDDS